MPQVKTFCEVCRNKYTAMFSVKPISGRTTTEKKDYCEECKRKFKAYDLKQYVISGKGR